MREKLIALTRQLHIVLHPAGTVTRVVASRVQNAKQLIFTLSATESHHGQRLPGVEVLAKLQELRILEVLSLHLSKDVGAVGVFRLSNHPECLALLLTMVHDLSIPSCQIVRQYFSRSKCWITWC